MKEYRDVRSKVGFLELCKNPELVSEVSITAVNRIGADAAIIFSDILLILETMGFRLEFAEGKGPLIHNPFEPQTDSSNLFTASPREHLSFVLDAIRLTRKELQPEIPLIGFAGAPFTVAAYAIEGGGSKSFSRAKTLMLSEPDAWKSLMQGLSDATADYLNAQIEAGADVVQLFDSWVGHLSRPDYETYVLPYTKRLFDQLPKTTPSIHFGTGTGHLLDLMKKAGGDVIGVDSRISLTEGWKALGNVPLQGNLDPAVLLCPPEVIKRETAKVLKHAQGKEGHIFNLGHGVLPNTPVDHVRYLIDFVHDSTIR